MTTALYVIVFISSLALIGLMMIQEGSDQSSVLMGVAPEALWGRNKSVSREATLKRITVIAAVLFFVSTLLLAALS